MAEQSPALIRAVRVIDKFTDTTGIWVAWLNVPLVLAVAYEVIARYAFDAPTIWSFDVTYMLYGTIFMLGSAYALHKGAHIRTDFFYEKWSTKTKGMIDSISYIVFFFPSILMFGWRRAGTRPGTPSPSTRPPSRRRGGRSCGRSRRWCRSTCAAAAAAGRLRD